MSCILHVVDAFTSDPFHGNPAAVCILEEPISDARMQSMAREINLSETAFSFPVEGGFSLRWFTPRVEVKLCGHATLATAFTLWKTGALEPHQPARFQTLSGWLTCRLAGNWIEMDFPTLPVLAAEAPSSLLEGLGAFPLFAGTAGLTGTAGLKWLVELESEEHVRSLKPNFTKLSALPVQGIIVTSRANSTEFDFVSRYFAPASGVNEDPVTGSAHCALAPYWSPKLGKSDFTAFQVSDRGGVVRAILKGERTLLSGQAVLVSRIEMFV